MYKAQDHFKQLLATNEKALEFYLTNAPFGTFYFNKNNIQKAFVDDRMYHSIKMDMPKAEAFDLAQYLDEASFKKLQTWIDLEKTIGKDIELTFKTKEGTYTVNCDTFKHAADGTTLFGLKQIDKRSNIPNEQYFSYIIENAIEGIIVFENEVLTYASPAYLEMMGDSLEDLIGKGADWAFGAIHPEDRPKILELFKEIRSKKLSASRYRFRVLGKEGKYIWREDHASFTFGENGHIERSVVVCKDITQQIEVERNLHKSENMYHSLFDNLQIGLLIADRETNILEVNDVACSVIGLPREILTQGRINDPNWIIFNENLERIDVDHLPACITAATGNAVAPVKMGYNKHDEPEKIKWVELSSSPLFNEKAEIDKIVCTFLDVTEKHEAEKRVQIEKSRLDNVINSVKLGTWEWQMAEGRTDFNIYWAEMLGHTLEEVTPGSFELWSSKVHPEDLSKAQEAIEKHINGETDNYAAEFRMKHKKGHWVWIIARGKIISRDSNGKPVLFSGTHNDITARKKQEEELRLFESVIKHNIDSVLITEAKPIESSGPKIIFANEAFCKMTGYSEEELLQSDTDMLRGPLTDPRIIEEIDRSVLELKPFQYELINYKKNGEPFWVNLSATPILNENGEYTHWITIQRDVTIQKAKEEELRLFESIVKNTKDSVLVTEAEPFDEPGPKIIFVNEAFCRMTGYTPQELIGKTPRILQGPKSDRKKLDEIRKSLQNWEPFESELVNYKKNGEEFWINLSVTPLANKKGWFTHWIAVERDITEQKENDLKLIEAKEKAETANVAKSDFLANMSHEIRTPLNSVIGFSELLMQTHLDDSQRDYMRSVNYSANTLLDLINDILDFSKIEAGKLELNLERTNLYEMLYQIMDMIKFKVHEKQIELLLHIAPNVPKTINVDPVRLRQILINLMGNAAKFTEKGEIELAVTVSNESSHGERTPLKFEVRDTGIGISESKQQTIFEAFGQEDTSTTRKYGGTGLGLSISNKLLHLMGTELRLSSEQGKGSRFYFDIDIEYEAREKHKELEINNIDKVLVVDDNLRSQAIIKSILNASEVMVDTATNGIEALVKLQDNWQSYDAVLIDHKMPFMDGIEVVEKINENLELTSEDLVIFMMDGVLNEVEHKVLKEKYGIAGFLHKPVIRKELFSLIVADGTETTISNNITEQKSDSIDLNGKSLLIVDDNPINRKLAKNMIAKLYKDVSIYEVEDGKSAIESVSQHDFGLVLMDVQMPGMSGYDATKKIRSMQENGHRIPIIALTAGTVKGEKERCLAAGMDDYLSKPVTMDKLEEMIRKWSNIQKGEDKTEKEMVTESSKLDFDYKALLERLGNDAEFGEEVLNMVRQGELKQPLLTLNELRNQTDKTEEIKALAHRIKGTALNLCFERLADIAGQIENLKPGYSNHEIDALFKQLDVAYHKVEKIILEMTYDQKETSS